MQQEVNKRGRLQFLIIVLVFLGPMVVAAWMYTTGRLQPESSTNHGNLIDPVVQLNEALPGSSPLFSATEAPWTLLYMNEGSCDEPCHDALYRLRQIRLMLGKDVGRVDRVFLHGDLPPSDLDFQEQQRGLATIADQDFGRLLDKSRPKDLPAGGIYLIDPLHNLIMYFSPDLVPRDMADDLKHLLRLSRIG